jgi:hypothetical protein
MDFNGDIILEPIYANIYFTHDPNRIIVCTGTQSYIHLHYLEERAIGKFDCITGLDLGMVGLIDHKKNVIIPIEYSYIAEVSLGHYVANLGCEIFDCETHTDKEDDPYKDSTTTIRGGVWFLFDNDGVKKTELNPATAHSLLQAFKQFNKVPIIVLD